MAKIDSVKRNYIHARETMDVISRTELLERMKLGEVVLIDVRPEDEYKSGHILGAINVPRDDLNDKLNTLPPDKEIIAYCRGPYCVLSHQVVDQLREHGFNSRRLADGYPEWKAEGLRVAND